MSPNHDHLGPQAFSLPSQWDALRAALAELEETDALKAVLETAMGHDPTYALLEDDYIDVDFRDEYVHYYASTYRPLPNRCRRLHFFRTEDGRDRYLGYCILRPVRTRPVCRTLVSPPEDLRPYISCQVSTDVRPYGARVGVSGFPFMEQDARFGVCAHASVWMVALYHHHKNATPRRLLSDVARGASRRTELFRVTPSEGLSATQVGAALDDLGLPGIPYAVNSLPKGQTIARIACRYLNSQLPVILTTPVT